MKQTNKFASQTGIPNWKDASCMQLPMFIALKNSSIKSETRDHWIIPRVLFFSEFSINKFRKRQNINFYIGLLDTSNKKFKIETIWKKISIKGLHSLH